MTITLPWRTASFGPEIQTSITEPEAHTLIQLARDKNVLEIGAAYGYSTILMAQVAEHVLSVDPHLVHDSLSTHTRNLKLYGVEDRVARIVCSSKEALAPMDPWPFDFIFVDGDHTAEGLWSDVLSALRLCRPGGTIAFHDWDETTCPDVKPTLEKWMRPDYVIDTLAVYGV
jgi:predicted O-methyltransferase YrrM